jgi:hypothetical protein
MTIFSKTIEGFHGASFGHFYKHVAPAEPAYSSRVAMI